MGRTVVALVLGLALCLVARLDRAVAQEVIFCESEPATIVASGPGDVYGTGGRDVIYADDDFAQTIYGLGGRDLICAGGGGDVVYAGSGNDEVFAVGTTAVYGEAGNDFLQVLTGIVSGGSGNDTLIDGNGATLLGDSGNDVLISGAVCDGGSGRDTAEGCGTTINVP